MEKKKVIVICIFVVLFLIGCICGFKYYQSLNEEFIKNYDLSDDVKFLLNNSDISNSEDVTYFTDAVSFQLKHEYSLMMEVKVDDSIVYTKKLGNIRGKGKYYYRFSNNGKTLSFSDYLISLKEKKTNNWKEYSYNEWTDIPYEVSGVGKYQSVESKFKKNVAKSLIGGVSWKKSINYDDKSIVKIFIYATKVK